MPHQAEPPAWPSAPSVPAARLPGASEPSAPTPPAAPAKPAPPAAAEESRGCLFALSQPPLMLFLGVIGMLLLLTAVHDLYRW
ncbi:hypothetical protein [Streptomyces sp. SAJ15]|uniref:hypothetical protein n=1 Tax=Streptomyces sp. SAJ15 TaxID=2011095 RepID=UPI001186A448|nr:hypothetical protein [Streptomyces sp. SAJ15]TVL93143.1 hypothetical protein CD790_08480 [Streptomyces sp. SAJ15]